MILDHFIVVVSLVCSISVRLLLPGAAADGLAVVPVQPVVVVPVVEPVQQEAASITSKIVASDHLHRHRGCRRRPIQ